VLGAAGLAREVSLFILGSLVACERHLSLSNAEEALS
jgi:hypothetical protein